MSGSLFTASGSSTAVLTSACVKLFGQTPSQIIGKKIAFTLYIPTEDKDKRVTITELTGATIVSGVVTDEEKSLLYLPMDAVAGLTSDHYDGLKVKVDSHENLEAVRTAIISQGFIVSSLSDIIDQATKVFGIIQLVLGFFGLVALIVSAIGMFNTMTIALMERTGEIGIMRSIGITRGDIRKMFLVESMVMGFLGGMGGLFLGTAVGEGVNVFVNMLAHRFHGPSVNLFYSPFWFVLVIIIFSTVIGFLTGVYPSIRASKLNPLDALRYK